MVESFTLKELILRVAMIRHLTVRHTPVVLAKFLENNSVPVLHAVLINLLTIKLKYVAVETFSRAVTNNTLVAVTTSHSTIEDSCVVLELSTREAKTTPVVKTCHSTALSSSAVAKNFTAKIRTLVQVVAMVTYHMTKKTNFAVQEKYSRARISLIPAAVRVNHLTDKASYAVMDTLPKNVVVLKMVLPVVVAEYHIILANRFVVGV